MKQRVNYKQHLTDATLGPLLEVLSGVLSGGHQYLSLALLACLVLVGRPFDAVAGPIYMYRQAGGVVRFSTRPPPAGVSAQVFTSKGRYSTVGTIRSPRGKLFLDHFDDLISSAAKSQRLDSSLVRAVIHVESAFNPRAVSPKGALGLMQLMPGTARMHGVTKPFDPAQNIEGGTKHLAKLVRRYNGNLRLALAAYNAGEGAVDQYGGVPPFSETTSYIDRVLGMKTRYRVALAGRTHPSTAG